MEPETQMARPGDRALRSRPKPICGPIERGWHLRRVYVFEVASRSRGLSRRGRCTVFGQEQTGGRLGQQSSTVYVIQCTKPETLGDRPHFSLSTPAVR